MSELNIAFGQRLQELRREHGLSKEALAIRAEMHATAVRRLERGEREPRISTVMRLARGLNVPPGALLDPLVAAEQAAEVGND